MTEESNTIEVTPEAKELHQILMVAREKADKLHVIFKKDYMFYNILSIDINSVIHSLEKQMLREERDRQESE